MNETKRRSIVWNTIERIAFRPNQPERWLGVYAKTLHKLWDIEPTWARFALNDKFSVTFLNLECCYSIDSVDKYSASLLYDSSDLSFWRSHVDSGFLSKGSLQTCFDSYPRRQMGKLRRDVEAVLTGMLFHPRCHTHLEDLGVRNVQLDQDSGALTSNEARIGGGIENSYVFLFHLRYQFCLVSNQTRESEKTRLIDLFENAIPNNLAVNARDLFNFRDRNN